MFIPILLALASSGIYLDGSVWAGLCAGAAAGTICTAHKHKSRGKSHKSVTPIFGHGNTGYEIVYLD